MNERFLQTIRSSAEVLFLCEQIADEVARLSELLIERLRNGGTVFTFGNGGSAAEAVHFTGELVGRFRRERRSLPAVALVSDLSTLTAIGNDYGYEQIFARQVEALVKAGDLVIGLSTSGTSVNVLEGLQAAKRRGATTVLLTSQRCSAAVLGADLLLRVPTDETARAQEAHLVILHYLCEEVDRAFGPSPH
ncbi:MAG: SIS domain-containing protein [Armatimonadetes bacterium]|nr:SIS domain-containing protein [Armatimonadota bacterium]MDW8123073.1 SIS domain-containing protein [Armatimonadota bacterium]